MGQKLLLDVSPTGVQHYAEVDNEGNELTIIEHTPDIVEQEILDSNQRLRSLHQRKGAQFQHAARIPINTYEQWKREWHANFRDKFTWPEYEVMKLNSRDNCKMRTGMSSGAFGKRL